MSEWEKIVAEHGRLVWRTAWRLLGDHADAGDCFQETFLAALELSRRQGVRNWGGLLQRLATCTALDRLRTRKRQTRRGGPLADWSHVPSNSPGPAADAVADELSAALREALTELPPDQAEAFALACLGGMKYRQVARVMGIRTSAVGVLIHRGRGRLRELLSSHRPLVQRPEKDVEVSA